MLSAISYSPLVKIDLGPLSVSPHGIFIAIGFLVGAGFFLRDTRRRGIEDDPVIEVLMRAAIGAIIGARFVYVLNHLDSYASPVEWLKVWEGGISLLGGLAGGVLVGWWAGRRRGLDVVGLLDLACPWFPLGIAVGRIGDLIIADHLGPTTSMPFGFRCPPNPDVGDNVGSPCPPGEVVHLTAAYDMLAAATIFVVMFLLRRRLLERRGQAALALVALYGLNRFTLDFVRADDRRLGLTGSQWTALVALIVATSLLAVRWRRPTDDPRQSEPVDQTGDIARRP